MAFLEDGDIAGLVTVIDHLLKDRFRLTQKAHLLDECLSQFQGFQPECGLTLEYIANKRTRDGDAPILFGPLAVTTELPVLSPEEIRDRTRQAIDYCRDRAHLALFTSNTINPDVPLENVLAMHEAALEG